MNPHEASLLPRHDIPVQGRSNYCLIDDRQVHYLEWGGVECEHVIALHGGGQTAYMYEDIGRALSSEGFHLIAPDLPSHGDSEGLSSEEGLNRSSLAQHMARFLYGLGIDSVHIIGASLGGLVGTSLAIAPSLHVKSLALLDVGPEVDAEGVDRIAAFMASHDSFGDLAEAAAVVEEYLSVRVGLVEPDQLRRNLRQRDDGRWVWKHATNGPAPVVELVRRLPRGWASLFDGLEVEAGRVTCPVLMIRGRESDVVRPSDLDDARRAFHNISIVEASSAGHLVVGDNPGATSAALKEFLESVRIMG